MSGQFLPRHFALTANLVSLFHVSIPIAASGPTIFKIWYIFLEDISG